MHLSGADRIARVADDDVELALLLAHEGRPVLDVDLHARVLEAAGHVREVGLARVDHALVDLADVHLKTPATLLLNPGPPIF